MEFLGVSNVNWFNNCLPNFDNMLFVLLLFVPLLVISQDTLPGVPGTPGADYPVLSAPLPTSFDCNDGFIEGYYAHTEVICKYFMIK